MSFLEVGVLLCSAIIGVSISILGFALEPGWTWSFILQLVASITVFPITVLVTTIAVFHVIPENVYESIIRIAVPSTLITTTIFALWSIGITAIG